MYEDRIMVIAQGLQGALTSTGGVFVITDSYFCGKSSEFPLPTLPLLGSNLVLPTFTG